MYFTPVKNLLLVKQCLGIAIKTKGPRRGNFRDLRLAILIFEYLRLGVNLNV